MLLQFSRYFKIFVLSISQSCLNMGYVWVKTRSRGQISQNLLCTLEATTLIYFHEILPECLF